MPICPRLTPRRKRTPRASPSRHAPLDGLPHLLNLKLVHARHLGAMLRGRSTDIVGDHVDQRSWPDWLQDIIMSTLACLTLPAERCYPAP